MMHNPQLRYALALLCSAFVGCAHGLKPMGQRLLPHNGGRITDAGLPPSATGRCTPLTWTAAAWEARFDGTRIDVQLRCAPTDLNGAPAGPCLSQFEVDVDGQKRALLGPVGAATAWYTVAEALAPGPHEVAVRRRGEAQLGTVCLCGVRPCPGRMLPPPPAKRRGLLVLGDSISAGYGNLCPSVHAGDPMGREDGTQTYGAVAARALGAEVRILAWSGIGLWRNGDGSMGPTLPDRWARATGGAPAAEVDAIVVNLGTNDLRKPDVDEHAFVARYVAFVRQLARAYPKAHILLAVGPMLQDAAPTQDLPHPSGGGRQDALRMVRRTLENLQSNPEAPHESAYFTTHLHLLEFATQDSSLGLGCDYHPNCATHAQMARTLEARLRALLGWS